MKKLALMLFVSSVIAPLTGCDSSSDKLPELGQVTGRITMDGQPLAAANVRFESQDQGALSTGLTDQSGEYSLYYTSDAQGAVVGKHTVRIDKFPEPGQDSEVALLPARYSTESELAAEIKPGKNRCDFELSGR